MLRLSRLTVPIAVGLALPWACSSDKSVLEKKPSTGGTGGTAQGDASSEDAPADAPADGITDSPPDVFVEPTGKTVLTLMHGVVDAPRIAFCFSKVEDGVPGVALGSPLPAGGLTWGQALVVQSLSGFDWASDDLLPIVVAGDFTKLAGKTCPEIIALGASLAEAGSASDASLDAGDASLDASPDAQPSDAASELPPPPIARSLELPALPAGTLAGGYSTLLVASGCIGGPGYTDDYETYLCGEGYTPSSPTLIPVLVRLSRVTEPGKLGLQFVNAARAADPIDLVSTAPEGSSFSDVNIVFDAVFGSVGPKPPLFRTKAAFGSPLSAAIVEVNALNASAPFYTESWGDALAAGGLTDVSEGSTYAFVLIGPRPSVAGMKWWNGPRLVLLPTEPPSGG